MVNYKHVADRLREGRDYMTTNPVHFQPGSMGYMIQQSYLTLFEMSKHHWGFPERTPVDTVIHFLYSKNRNPDSIRSQDGMSMPIFDENLFKVE